MSEIDTYIAQEVLGCKIVKREAPNDGAFYTTCGCGDGSHSEDSGWIDSIKPYSESLSAAWEVVEAMRNHPKNVPQTFELTDDSTFRYISDSVDRDAIWFAAFCRGYGVCPAGGNTPALAICRAAKRTIELSRAMESARG